MYREWTLNQSKKRGKGNEALNVKHITHVESPHFGMNGAERFGGEGGLEDGCIIVNLHGQTHHHIEVWI